MISSALTRVVPPSGIGVLRNRATKRPPDTKALSATYVGRSSFTNELRSGIQVSVPSHFGVPPGFPVPSSTPMAKMAATESAQQVIDAAVQILGGLGVKRGHIVESLYREIRALRIYEGATEVQKLIIARALLKEAK